MDREQLKRAAAYRALDFVKDGMVLGLGTGSTAYFVVEGLGKRVAEGLAVVGIPTSERTAAQARSLNIPLSSFSEHSRIDLTIDGADEVERETLYLIKGLGGALLREKIVAAASDQLVIVVDQEKLVAQLGERTPVPVEVVQFGWQATAASLTKLGGEPALRHATEDHPFITDGGNYILDCRFATIADPRLLEQQIGVTVGVVESGLFIGRTTAVVAAFDGGVEILPPENLMTQIKLVITDVDGTLVTTEKALRPSSVAAVRKLYDAGIGFTICSSRPPFGLTTMRDALQITLPFGGYNGGSIVEPDLTVIEQVCIPPAVARQAVDIFHANGIDTWVFVGNEWVILNRQGDHVDHEIHTIDVPPTVVGHYEDKHFGAVGKIVGASNNHDLVAKVEQIMKEALGHSAHAARSQAYYCDVIAPGIDKGHIVEVLGKRLGLARDEIAVLGDMTNDLEMFAAAGFPIAMGNAPDHVKAAAKAVAPGTNDEDGWAGAVEQYILRA